jgi:putative SOS response-associated peptidase YedK
VKEARWGLINSWAKDAKSSFKPINARTETIDKSPAFRSAFKKHRCLVPADASTSGTARRATASHTGSTGLTGD